MLWKIPVNTTIRVTMMSLEQIYPIPYQAKITLQAQSCAQNVVSKFGCRVIQVT